MVKLTDINSIPSVIEEMTLEEKALLCTGDSLFSTYPIERLGIPKVWLLDGATGVNLGQLYWDIIRLYGNQEQSYFDGPIPEGIATEIKDKLPNREIMSEEAKKVYDVIERYIAERMPEPILPGCFPPGILLASTMNPDIVYSCGSAVAREEDAYGIDVVLGPNVNIHRDPRNGRIYEGYSEDPCLVSTLAPNFVKGMQDEGVLADVKHFAANNQETYRENIDEIISERALREIYLPGFKACVDAGVETLMVAYNQVNGQACAMNDWLLQKILRGEWNYKGTIITDWWAGYDQVEDLKAGTTLDMPGKRDIKPIIDAVQQGTLQENTLDRAVEYVLRMILKTITFKGEGRRHKYIDKEYSRKAAYDAASEGIVLLKNENVLPIKEGSKIAFFGEGSNKFIESGLGSTYIRSDRSTALLDECKKYASTCTYGNVKEDDDVVIICVRGMGQEGSDRNGLELDSGELEVALDALTQAKSCGKKSVLVLNVAGPIDLRLIKDKCDAIICVFLPGMEGGHALADILFGKVNPSGKLPITFPEKLEDVPAYINFPGNTARVFYGEGIFVGYRYYEMKGIKPLYPFGYGLSYTDFQITNLNLDKPELNLNKNEVIRAKVSIKNIGTVTGKDTVQLYIKAPGSELIKPQKELKAFSKVELLPNEVKYIEFIISKEMLESFDDKLEQWATEPGVYNIMVGDSSDNISNVIEFTVIGNSLYSFGRLTPLEKIVGNPEAKALLYKYIDACEWDSGMLDDALVAYPDRAISMALKQAFPYDEKSDLWETYYKEINKIG